MCVSGVAVCLRFISRRLIKQPFLWDDWLIVIALPFAWAVGVCELVGIYEGGYGRHIQTLSIHEMSVLQQTHWANSVVTIVSISLTKLSIVLFYRRIFGTSEPKIKWGLIAIAALVISWFIATEISAILSCIPIEAFWNFSIEGNCYDGLKWNIGIGIPNILTDFIILVFPMPMVWRLQMRPSQKIAVSVAFILGGFIVVVSTLRCIAVSQIENLIDFSWSLIPIGNWTIVEANIGILCACLPSMRPLLQLVIHGSVSTFTGSKSSNAASKSANSSRSYWRGVGRSHKSSQRSGDFDNFAILTDSTNAASTGCPTTSRNANGTSDKWNGELEEGKRPQHGIEVRQDVE
ncbi:hypothetical protein MMC30_001754 [Trapelia coarctata]|nr:hypothetical protein [Trapelia coarctata]